MATATLGNGNAAAIAGGALVALLANCLIPESPLRPSKLLRRAVAIVGGLKGGTVDLDDQQRELLKGNERLFSSKDLVLLRMLMEEGQGHVIAFWAEVGTNDERKKALGHQLSTIDGTYPGGLRAYVKNGKALLAAACRGDNPYAGFVPEVPEGVTLSLVREARAQFEKYEQMGLEAVKHTGFVLVAGGLGERLGYSGIKVSLPVETASNISFLETYIQCILRLQKKSGAKKPLPLAIMTSDDTHDQTLELLQNSNYFGAKSQQVHLIKQGRVPCFGDPAGHLALDTHDPYALQVKPHGHGDVHALMHSSGLAKKWLSGGFKWSAFFQDTNSMVFRGLLPTLGVSAEKDWDMNSLCVPRVAKEAIGAICTLRSNDGACMTVNVEYNQLDPLLRSTIQPNGDRAPEVSTGDVNDSTGYSPFPGNINQLVIKLSTYEKQLSATQGVIAEFVNPKFKDSARTAFKKPTRLECMMQDFPKTLPPDSAVGFTTMAEVWATYMPVKNSPDEARAKAKAGNPTHSATHGEFGVYDAWGRLLRSLGATVGTGGKTTLCGLPVNLCSHLAFAPSFITMLSDVRERFLSPQQVTISTRSSLVVSGDVTIEHLDLDGALVLCVDPGAQLTIRSLVVRNKGWIVEAVSDDSSEPEKIRMRGFKFNKRAGCLIHVTAGEVALDATENGATTLTYSPKETRTEWKPPEF